MTDDSPTDRDDSESSILSAEYLLEFYKTLADPERLLLAGVLAAAPATVVDLAGRTGIAGPAVVRHLARLTAVGVAVEDPSGRFSLDTAGLRERSRQGLDSPRSRAMAGATDERSKVIANLFRDGRLTGFPTGDNRKLIVLAEIAGRFDAERSYTEREVNEILKPIYADYTTIRRALVDYHFMNRDKGVYWLGRGHLDEQAPSQ
jgi:hypothetical protein